MVTVEMMGEMSLDDWDEKSEKTNDHDKVDGMRQEIYSKGEEMHNEMSNLWFLKRKTRVVERW